MERASREGARGPFVVARGARNTMELPPQPVRFIGLERPFHDPPSRANSKAMLVPGGVSITAVKSSQFTIPAGARGSVSTVPEGRWAMLSNWIESRETDCDAFGVARVARYWRYRPLVSGSGPCAMGVHGVQVASPGKVVLPARRSTATVPVPLRVSD